MSNLFLQRASYKFKNIVRAACKKLVIIQTLNDELKLSLKNKPNIKNYRNKTLNRNRIKTLIEILLKNGELKIYVEYLKVKM